MLPQLRVLRRNAHRTGVQIADAHHNAAHRYKGRRRKTVLFRAENRRNRHISAAHQLTVRFHAHFIPQTVLNQCLMRFRQTEFPGQTGVMNRTSGRRARSAVITRYENDLCARFRNACRHRSDARFRNEFHGDSRPFVGIF